MSQMSRHDHGGYCCGMKHLQGFGQSPEARDDNGGSKLERLNDFLHQWDVEEAGHGPGNQRILEVVLTDRQAVGWHETLLVKGFRKVMRFYNSNSRNHCNLYVKHALGVEVFDVNAQVLVPPVAVAAAAQAPAQAPNPARPFAVGDRVRYVGTHWRERRNAVGVIRAARNNYASIGILFDDVNLRGTMNEDGVVYAMRTSVRHEAHGQPEAPAAVAPPVRDNAELEETRRNLTLRTEELRVSRAAATQLQQQNAQLIEERDRQARTIGTQMETIRRLERPIERAVIFSDYYADLRIGGRKGPFPGLNEVTERYPRCRNIQRRDIYNNGDVVIERQAL